MNAVAELASTQTHLQLLQGLITRMAGNSANCKTWCVTMLAGLLALSFGQGQQQVLFVAYGVIALFFGLDGYYLGLEKGYRTRYNRAIQEISTGEPISELFALEPAPRLGAGLGSRVTWLFYALLATAIAATQVLTFYLKD